MEGRYAAGRTPATRYNMQMITHTQVRMRILLPPPLFGVVMRIRLARRFDRPGIRFIRKDPFTSPEIHIHKRIAAEPDRPRRDDAIRALLQNAPNGFWTRAVSNTGSPGPSSPMASVVYHGSS